MQKKNYSKNPKSTFIRNVLLLRLLKGGGHIRNAFKSATIKSKSNVMPGFHIIATIAAIAENRVQRSQRSHGNAFVCCWPTSLSLITYLSKADCFFFLTFHWFF